jgi:hypothetical protein
MIKVIPASIKFNKSKITLCVSLLLMTGVCFSSPNLDPKFSLFVWTFKHDVSAPISLVTRMENYLEATLTKAKYANYFIVMERKKFSELYELSKNEDFLSGNKGKEQLKTIGANAVFIGEVSYYPIEEKIQIHVKLWNLNTSVSIAAGYINIKENDIRNEAVCRESYEKMLDEDFIKKIDFLEGSMHKYSRIYTEDFEKAKELMGYYHLCLNKLNDTGKNESSRSETNSGGCFEMEKAALKILKNLEIENDFNATWYLLKYYKFSGKKDSLEKLTNRILNKGISKEICEEETKYSTVQLLAGQNCTELLLEKSKNGQNPTKDQMKKCYEYQRVGLTELHLLLDIGCPCAGNELIKFYENTPSETCPKCKNGAEMVKNQMAELEASKH